MEEEQGKRGRGSTGALLNNAGSAAIIIFVNKAGKPLSKSPMATVVHISAGQKKEVPAHNR
jgi:hypothetical protein